MSKTRKVTVEYSTPPPYQSCEQFSTEQCLTTGWIKDLKGQWTRPEEYTRFNGQKVYGYHVIMYPGDKRPWINPTEKHPNDPIHKEVTPGTTGPH